MTMHLSMATTISAFMVGDDDGVDSYNNAQDDDDYDDMVDEDVDDEVVEAEAEYAYEDEDEDLGANAIDNDNDNGDDDREHDNDKHDDNDNDNDQDLDHDDGVDYGNAVDDSDDTCSCITVKGLWTSIWMHTGSYMIFVQDLLDSN